MFSSPVSNAAAETLAKRRADATLPLSTDEVSRVETLLTKLLQFKPGAAFDLAKLLELAGLSRDRAPMLFAYLKSCPAYAVRFYNGCNYVSKKEVKS